MDRRDAVLALLALGAAPLAARAQLTAKPARIAWLGLGSPEYAGLGQNALKQGLRELGYLESKDFVLVSRLALGKAERLPDLAKELVALHPDVIMVSTSGTTRAAQQATTTIPIVFVGTGDPVENGFVKSLAHPGGNITGLSAVTAELTPKMLELLLSVVPKLSRVAVLWNPSAPALAGMLKNVQTAARRVSVNILPVEAQTPAEIESAFVSMTRAHAGAVLILPDLFFGFQGRQIVELVLKNRIPSIFYDQNDVKFGGLMSYGVNALDNYRRSATYVDKILKGTKPADLPVEEPMRFELVINLKAAKTLGIKIPQSVLIRADQVIE